MSPKKEAFETDDYIYKLFIYLLTDTRGGHFRNFVVWRS